MLTHDTLWRAIDALAEKNNLTPSGLAKKAGLSATIFNASKRKTAKRKRWPSSESLAAILTVTSCPLDEFMELGGAEPRGSPKISVLTLSQAAQPQAFTEMGLPENGKGEPLSYPIEWDPSCFAIEIDTVVCEPEYKRGTTLIVSPMEKIRRGDRIALKLRGSEILIRRLNREGAQKVELSSLVQETPPETVLRQEIVWIYRIIWASQ